MGFRELSGHGILRGMRAAVDLPLFLPFLESGRPILTPGKRLARDITSSWVMHEASKASVVSRPAVEPVDSWLEDLWRGAVEKGQLPPQRLLTPQQALAVWQQIIRDDLADRVGFSLTHPRIAAQRAQSAWSTLVLNGGAELADLWSYFQFDEDCQVFSEWARQYSARLDDLGAVSRHGAYQQLLSLPEEQKPSVGLFAIPELPPLTRKVLDHLASVTLIEPARRDHQKLRVASFINREEELAAAARWAYERSTESDGRTAIVLLDMQKDRQRLEYFLREAFDCLDAQYNDLPVNFSTGMSLASTPMYRDALTVLEWESGALSRADWLALMRSPYLPLHESGQGALGLIEAQFRAGSLEVSLESALHVVTRELPGSGLAGILRALRSSRTQRGVKNLADWSGVIRERLALWQWPARTPLDSIEYQQFQRFEASLDALNELSGVLPYQSYDAAIRLWRDCLDNIVFQPKTPHDSIQVLGPVEAVGGQFDALWLCGVQHTLLPARKRSEPFLPASVQTMLGLPDLDERVLQEQAIGLLQVWSAESPSTLASFHLSEQGLPAQPSTLLPPVSEAHDGIWFPPPRWLTKAGIEVMPPDVPMRSGSATRSGGSSLIRDQAACPFRAFVRHRLKVPSLQEPIVGISAAERGGLLHEALFRAWRSIGSQDALIALEADQERQLVRTAVTEAMAHVEAGCEARGYSLRERVGGACWQLEQHVCADLLSEWLSLERKRDISFKVLEMEQNHTLDLNGLMLTLRPDRIDEYDDGRRVVIDYKTRAPSKNKWLGHRPEEPQLPLYALLDQAIEGIAFGALPAGDPVKFVAMGEDLGMGKAGVKPLDQQTTGAASTWQELVGQWHTVLHRLATDFLEGAADVAPQRGACQYCDLAPVCRINQLRELSELEQEEPAE